MSYMFRTQTGSSYAVVDGVLVRVGVGDRSGVLPDEFAQGVRIARVLVAPEPGRAAMFVTRDPNTGRREPLTTSPVTAVTPIVQAGAYAPCTAPDRRLS